MTQNTSSATRLWILRSANIREVVRAVDQWEAWDTLRARPVSDFGLIVIAEPDEDEDESILVHSETLFRRWGREDDAALADQAARREGLR